MRLEEIKEIISRHRQELEQRYKVKKIAIFGSYVRGEEREGSDVDILVEFTMPVSLLHIVSLENYLSDIIGLKIDLVPEKNIRKELRDTILKEAVPI